jgi:hypothetical protein
MIMTALSSCTHRIMRYYYTHTLLTHTHIGHYLHREYAGEFNDMEAGLHSIHTLHTLRDITIIKDAIIINTNTNTHTHTHTHNTAGDHDMQPSHRHTHRTGGRGSPLRISGDLRFSVQRKVRGGHLANQRAFGG